MDQTVPVSAPSMRATGWPVPSSDYAAVGARYEAGGSELLKSSAQMGWNGRAAAAIYKHHKLDCESFVQSVTEVIVNLSGSANFRRKADGPEQRYKSRVGSASICPRGVSVRYLQIDSGPLDMIHLSVPTDLFGTLKCLDGSAEGSGLLYTGGLRDPLLESIGFAVAEELMQCDADRPTGQLLLDSYALAAAARLLQRYVRKDTSNFTKSYFEVRSAKGLDRARLQRVVEFINVHLSEDMSLDQLANVACLSTFHFCRAFKIATGLAPFQYIGDARIQRAKSLLADRQTTIDDVAVSAGFSSGANLARAFKKALGVSPRRYRFSLTA